MLSLDRYQGVQTFDPTPSHIDTLYCGVRQRHFQIEELDGNLTFLPTSSSRKKNPAPRSSSATSASSTTMSLPIPARTIFLIVSVAVPRSVKTAMVALRMLPYCVSARLSDKDYQVLRTAAALPNPRVGSGDHTVHPHLCAVGSEGEPEQTGQPRGLTHLP